MGEAEAVITWLERVSRVGFGTLLGLILFGNFLGIWVWGRIHRADLAKVEALLAKAEQERDEWKEMALGLLSPLERTVRPPVRKQRE